jgi:predicted TIM-barrel fold metal-dependent hydrolase
LQLDGPKQLPELQEMLLGLAVPFVVDATGRFGPDDLNTAAFRSFLILLETGRCWVKLHCASRRLEMKPPYELMWPVFGALARVRPDRLLWGSDWPHVQHWNQPVPRDVDLLESILEWSSNRKIAGQILTENPANLCKFV